MLQEKLKTSTAQLHTELEQLMLVNHIMQRTLNVPQYTKILLTNYISHLQYEAKIHEKLSETIANMLNITKRTKIAALAADLRDVNLSEHNISKKFLSTNASIPNESFALGAMYVLEGATLGGSVIVKQLHLNPNFPRDYSFNYYSIYAKDLIPNWQKFVAVLNSLAENQHQHAIDGANYMFNAIISIAKKINGLELEKSTD